MLHGIVQGFTRSGDVPVQPVEGGGQRSRNAAANLAENPHQLVEQLLANGRYALLLRPQIAQSLTPEQQRRAAHALCIAMSDVPAGEVQLESWTSSLAGQTPADFRGEWVPVEPLYLDRYAVTNEQFHKFVDAAGYEQPSLWHSSVWSRVAEFVDSTGRPGPKFWANGRYPGDVGDHPVVGVCWFEADAFARWVGKRLPYDAEWVKAASWPATAGAVRSVGRRYPWGDTIDSTRANLWFAGLGRTAPVTAFPTGASAGNIFQLVGNVWEWTSSAFQLWIDDAPAELDEPLMSIRGAAFDTYFERQAGCQAQSGESPLARRHNVGFRCALSACDVVNWADPSATEAG
jgi:iron(II)-dependent oxidoreductase